MLLPASLVEWARIVVVALIVAAITTPLAYCEGKSAGRAQMQLAIEQANTRFLTQKARADALAADQRITDTIAVNRQEEELRDAIASTPDSAPDAVRVQLGCARLRANGTSPADLPAVCGPSR
jgi:hypothetical protein